MYGFYAHGSESMVCQHVADWSRQVMRYLDGLRERGVPAERLTPWRKRFENLETEANDLLNPWQWGVQGMGAVAGLLERAYDALTDFSRLLQELAGGSGGKKEPGGGEEPDEEREPNGENEPEEAQESAELTTPEEEGDLAESGAPDEGKGADEPEGEVAHGAGGRRATDHRMPVRSAIRPVPIGQHVLPPLPYPYNALEPYIDEETMRLHHDILHRNYVEGLNKAERMMAEARRSGDYDLIKHWEREAAFNGAGHYLHTLFWTVMAPGRGGLPMGAVLEQIERDFGSFDQFKQHFSRAAEKVEGGGWALWVWSPRANRTAILTAEKHQNLTQWESIPLLVLDVWEHSYYLKYQTNRRAYIEAWWNLVNWPEVAMRLERASGLVWQPF